MNENHYLVCPHCDTVNRIPADRLGHGPKCGKCKQELFSAHPVNLTGKNFMSHVERSTIPVVVDFWAPWCGPCRTMAPVFEQAAARLEPQIRLAKLNTEEERAMAGQYGIMSIPTMVLFKGGKEIARQSGAMDINTLIDWIRSHLENI